MSLTASAAPTFASYGRSAVLPAPRAQTPKPASGLLGGPADSGGGAETSTSPSLHWSQTGQVSGEGETGAGRGSTT